MKCCSLLLVLASGLTLSLAQYMLTNMYTSPTCNASTLRGTSYANVACTYNEIFGQYLYYSCNADGGVTYHLCSDDACQQCISQIQEPGCIGSDSSADGGMYTSVQCVSDFMTVFPQGYIMTDMWLDNTCEGGPLAKAVSSLAWCYNMSDDSHAASQMYFCNRTHVTTYMYMDGACRAHLPTITIQAIGTCTDAMFLATKVTECATPGSYPGVTTSVTVVATSSSGTGSSSSFAASSTISSSTSAASSSSSAASSSSSTTSTSSAASLISSSASSTSSSASTGEAEEGKSLGSGSMAEHVVVALLAVTLFILVALVVAYRLNWLPEGAASAMDRILQREHRHHGLTDFEDGI